jgi:hypothetical protein
MADYAVSKALHTPTYTQSLSAMATQVIESSASPNLVLTDNGLNGQNEIIGFADTGTHLSHVTNHVTYTA